MNLNESLTAIAAQLDLDTDALIRFANEDYFTGWDNGAGMFPMGSLFGVEGKTLYALVSTFQATNVVELGTQYGASTSHIALAMQKRGVGKLTSVDIQEALGANVPDDLRAFVNFVHQDAIAYLKSLPDNSVHMLFEDLWHTAEMCEAVGREAMRILVPGGVLVAHDALHWVVGEGVRAGYDAAGIDYRMYLVPPSDCGLLIAQKPDRAYQVLKQFTKADDSPVKRKRSPRKKVAK